MVMQIRRTPTLNNPPTGLMEGQLAVEMSGPIAKLWVGVPTSIDPSGRRLLTEFLPLHGGTMDTINDASDSGTGITINNSSANKPTMTINNSATGWGVGLAVNNTNPTVFSGGGVNIGNSGFTGLSVINNASAYTAMFVDNNATSGSALWVRQWGGGVALAVNSTSTGGDVLAVTEDVAGIENLRLRIKNSGQITVGDPAVGDTIDTPGSVNVTDNYYINGVPIGGGNVAHGVVPPVSPNPGDLWFDPVEGQLYVYFNDGTSSQWVVTINQGGGGGGAGGPQMGVTDGSNATSGQVGEFFSSGQLNIAQGAGASATTVIPAGDWQVNCYGQFHLSPDGFSGFTLEMTLELRQANVAIANVLTQVDARDALQYWIPFSIITRVNVTTPTPLHFELSGLTNQAALAGIINAWRMR